MITAPSKAFAYSGASNGLVVYVDTIPLGKTVKVQYRDLTLITLTLPLTLTLTLTLTKDLPEPIKGCDGSLVFHPGTRKLYFSHPDPPLDLFRVRLRVWSSGNMGASWESHGK